jgi:hypothetical protein
MCPHFNRLSSFLERELQAMYTVLLFPSSRFSNLVLLGSIGSPEGPVPGFVPHESLSALKRVLPYSRIVSHQSFLFFVLQRDSNQGHL